VYGIRSGESYLLIGESWNLKARLLGLITKLNAPENLCVDYELCSEADRAERAEILRRQSLVEMPVNGRNGSLPGITFWASVPEAYDPSVDGRDA